MWVKSEYAGEVAVLSTWLSALMPWSVSFLSAADGSAIWLRFLPGRFLFIQGLGLPSRFDWAWEVPGFVGSSGETTAAYVWLASVALFVLPLVYSVAYYLDEERVEGWRLDPVRAIGGLLVASGVLMLAASGLLLTNLAGTTVPIGTLIQLGLGGILLTVDRT
jgi:uncharacterized protein (TIGR04206 family)